MNIQQLDYRKIKITHKGFSAVVRHISRFGYDKWNYLMLIRLLRIITGQQEATDCDKRYYSHELREYVWYRNKGWEKGEPDGSASNSLYRECHDNAITDYNIDYLTQRNLLFPPEVRSTED